MAHDILSPSSAVTWVNCPGAPALIDALPQAEETTAYAAEGTAAHEQAEAAAEAFFRGGKYYPTTDDAEMIRHARGWAECLGNLIDTRRLFFWATERPLALSGITGRDDAYGTADFIAIDVDGVLTIADFKYGMGVEVEAERNLQLSIYAMAAVDEFDPVAAITQVRLIIYQPRISEKPKVFTWEPSAFAEMRRLVMAKANLARSLIGDTEAAAKNLNPGESQCRFCKAKASCPALREKAKALIAADFDVVEPTKGIPLPQTAEELARALPWLDTIESWCDSVRKSSLALALNGTAIPGYKVVAGRKGARKWDAEAEEKLGRMRINRSVLYKKTLISPSQAEKAHKEGHIGDRQWRRISDFITQAEGKPTLAPNSDKRPAIECASVKDDFSVIE